MNMRTVSMGIVAACLCLGAPAIAAENSSEQLSTRAAANELFASRVAVGYRINPVDLRLRGKNRFLVGLAATW